MADARELVHHLLLLGLQLHGIGENLPFAAATVAVVSAYRLQPVRRRGNQPHEISFEITFAHLAHLHVHHIARHGLRHEQHLAIDMCKAVALGRYGLYKDIFEQWLIFLTSHINNRIYRPRGALNAL